MANREAMLQIMRQRRQCRIAGVALRHHQMRGQRRIGGAHRPDVQIMDRHHAGLAFEEISDCLRVDAIRHRIKRHRHRFAQQPPGAAQDHRDDDQAQRRVDPVQPGLEDQQPRHHHRRRNPGIGEHVKIGAADIHIALAPARKQPGGDAVDENPARRHRHDDAARHRLRIRQPPHRLDGNGATGDEQQHGVEQRRQDAAAFQPIGKARAGRTLRQPQTGPGDGEPEHVGQIVAGIGEQRHRPGGHARQRLDADIGEVERDADGKGAAEIIRRMAVPMVVVMPMVVMIMVAHAVSSVKRNPACV